MNIRPLTDFRNHYHKITDLCWIPENIVFLTLNGREHLVIMSHSAWSQIQENYISAVELLLDVHEKPVKAPDGPNVYVRPLSELKTKLHDIESLCIDNTCVFLKQKERGYLVLISHQFYEKLIFETDLYNKLAVSAEQARRGEFYTIDEAKKMIDKELEGVFQKAEAEIELLDKKYQEYKNSNIAIK